MHMAWYDCAASNTFDPNAPTGKDYSNPRISDFHTLSKPHEDMYDRSKVPRMPWYVAPDSSSSRCSSSV